MKVEPTEGYFLVKKLDAEKKTDAGIILPDSTRENTVVKAELLEVSSLYRGVELKGTILLFVEGPEIEVEHGGKKCFLIKSEHIIGRAKDE